MIPVFVVPEIFKGTKQKCQRYFLLSQFLSELAGLVVNILIARFMTCATEQHKGKE